MVILAIAVAVIAAVSLATLFLTLSLAREIRRRGNHGEPVPADLFDDAIGLQEGEAFPDVRLTANDGTPVDHGMVEGGRVLVGFFVANCPGCRRAVKTLASSSSVLTARPLGVVAGSQRPAEELIEQLVSAGIVTVVGSDAAELAAACRVELFPTFTLFDDGRVVATGLGEDGAKSLDRDGWGQLNTAGDAHR